MKTRHGFVSNSSSSSFCIYGIGLDDDIEVSQRIEILKGLGEDLNPLLDAQIKHYSSRNEEPNAWDKKQVESYTLLKNLSNGAFFAPVRERGCEHDLVSKADNGDHANFCPICGKKTWIEKENENLNKIEMFLDDEETFYDILGLEVHMMDDWRYVGQSWSGIGDDETGREFKASVEKLVALVSEQKCSTLEEAWRDG